MVSLLRAYNAALIRRPMIAQCGTSAVLFGTGDMIAQQAIEKKGLKNHDWARTARLTFYGGAMFGPIVTKWYQLLNRLQFQTATKATVYRVCLVPFRPIYLFSSVLSVLGFKLSFEYSFGP